MLNPVHASLRGLNSFGDVAAEDDEVLDYFLTTDAAARIARNEVFLVLGRKGAGKTALVRHFSEGQGSEYARPLSLRGYPWNVHAKRVDSGASAIEAYVSAWRYLIVTELASLLLTKLRIQGSKDAKALQRFLVDNYGGIEPQLETILRPRRLKLSKLSFEPEILGNKLGGVALERGNRDLDLGLELNALSDAILSSIKYIVISSSIRNVTLHFDELDQGLSVLDETRQSMLIGLILAARSIRLSCKDIGCAINPIVYLRTDIWNELDFSDKNKISQTLTLNLEWDSDSLKKLVNNRISARLGDSANWTTITSESLMRGSQKKWDHILARTFLRPRDVIKFLNVILSETKKRNEDPLVFESPDIVAARPVYSAYLKSELDDEILAHWKTWEEALQACSAISTLTFNRQAFIREYEKRRSAHNGIEPEDALRLLYSFSVLGYERRSGYGGSSWAFQYVDPEIGWDQSSSRYKVHLGLKEFAKLREERSS